MSEWTRIDCAQVAGPRHQGVPSIMPSMVLTALGLVHSRRAGRARAAPARSRALAVERAVGPGTEFQRPGVASRRALGSAKGLAR